MKKWFRGIAILLVVVSTILIFLIPYKRAVTLHASIGSPLPATYRAMTDQQFWNRVDSSSFLITKRLLNEVELSFQHDGQTVSGNILAYPLSPDSTAIHWTAELPPQKGLFKNVSNYLAALSIQHGMKECLRALDRYCSDPKNVYGFPIREGKTKDTMLLALRFTTSIYPSVKEVYDHIVKLRSVALSLSAMQTGTPMLNIRQQDSSFLTMVALPINKQVVAGGNSDVFFVRMLPGRFLVMEVKGGPETLKFAHRMFSLYIQENKETAMAIPFDYLITDRSIQPDSADWRTDIYWPVM